MSFLRLSALVPACFILTACGGSSVPDTPETNPKQVSRAVERAANKGAVIEGSVLRDEGKVSLALRLLDDEKADFYVQADCAGSRADWLFTDITETKAAAAYKERRYGNGKLTYAPPVALDESATRAVLSLKEAQEACGRKPSWREVGYNKKSDTQLLLEISSLRTQPDGKLNFWAAVDYPYLAYIRLSRAPYARRAGYYQVDCKKQTYSIHFVYHLDQQQTVTDGGAPGQPPVLDIQQATGDTAALMATVCNQENLASTLLPPESRGKRLPDTYTLPDADSAVLAEITKIRRLPAKMPIGYLRIEGTRTPKSGSAAARLSKSGFFQQDVLVEPSERPGVFHITRREGADRSEQISYLGLFPLSQIVGNADIRNTSKTIKLDLRGDWEKLPQDTQLGYWQRARVVDLVTNQSNAEAEVICRVTKSLDASTLNPRLTGFAKEIVCYTVGDKDDEITSSYYLEDYGFALLLGSTSLKYSLESRIVEIR
jgi:hypothetical protein